MADNPEVPDLKKAAESKPAGFAWNPGVAKSAASATNQAPPPSGWEKFKAQGNGRLALFAVLLVGGGLVFGLAAFHFGGGGEGGGFMNLGKAGSTPKIRFARQNDPTNLIAREKPAANETMRFDLIKGGAVKDGEDPAGTQTGAPGANGEGAAPMNYDEGSRSRAGTAGGPDAAASGGKGGAQGDGGEGGAKAPRLASSLSGVKFQGMQRISSTAGFRGIQGRRSILNKTVRGTGSSANSADSAYGSAAGGKGTGVSGAGGNAQTGQGVASALAAAGIGGGGSGAGGGGGGGGGGAANTDGAESTPEKVDQIKALMDEANKLHDQAEKDKKIAIAFKATGQDPQAVYYYEKYKKEDKQAKEKEDQAKAISATITQTGENMNAANGGNGP